MGALAAIVSKPATRLLLLQKITIITSNMLDKKILRKIQKIAIGVDHDAAFGGKSKGNKHLERAVRIALFLAEKSGADLNITEAGAWLHDTALPTGNDYDPEKNKRVVRGLLKGIDLTSQEVGRIAECAASHEGTKAPSSPEAKIVHDADVIEKTGILGLVRHTWKLTNSGKLDPEHVTSADVQAILSHIAWRKKQLRLPLSKKLAQRVAAKPAKKQARRIVATVAHLAQRGIITEVIATKLSKELSASQRASLKSQLSLAYLK